MSRSSKQALIGLGSLTLILSVVIGLAAAANRTTGLRADVLSARRTEPGTVEPFTVSVRDTKGRVTAVRIDFGDGRIEEVDVPEQACKEPMVQEFTLKHAYDFTGYSTVVAQVETGGCGAKPEQVEAIRTIQVRAVRR